MKYVAYSTSFGPEEIESSTTADTLIEADDGPEFTGLYDHTGRPVYRLRETVEIGFRVRS